MAMSRSHFLSQMANKPVVFSLEIILRDQQAAMPIWQGIYEKNAHISLCLKACAGCGD